MAPQTCVGGFGGLRRLIAAKPRCAKGLKQPAQQPNSCAISNLAFLKAKLGYERALTGIDQTLRASSVFFCAWVLLRRGALSADAYMHKYVRWSVDGRGLDDTILRTATGRYRSVPLPRPLSVGY
jgi:hypothetical protein